MIPLFTLALVHSPVAAPIPPASVAPFALRDVRLLDGPFKQAMELNAKVLLELDPDRLLHNVRLYAGLKPKGERYGGWESRGVAGHTLGHYLTALSQQYAATGDVRFRARIDAIVSEMARCQVRYGDGYVGALPPLELATLRGFREGKVEKDGAFGFKGGAWVPWYTMHKVLAGLRDAWVLGGSSEAKTVTLRLADWVDEMTKGLTPEQDQSMLGVEHGGMNEVLMDLYARTGDPRYLASAGRFYHKAVLDPLAEGRDELPGKHANTQIPKVIGMARAYEVTGDARGRAIAQNFWNLVTDRYTWAIGGNSDREHFFPENDADRHLGPETAETCNTYNMLKLTEHLFEWSPKVAYADFYERALYNHILASHDPKQGMFAYFVSLQPGGFRTYSTLDDSFWCCFGTGLENPTKYNEAIYFHGADSLYVNLFIPSELTWREKEMRLTQRTAYPRSDTTSLSIEAAPKVPLALRVRVPGWTAGTPRFVLNGKPLNVASSGGYATIRRAWKKGDRLSATFPMALRSESLRGDVKKVAFLYGPLVLAGDLGPAPDPYAGDHTANERVPVPDVPPLVAQGDPLKSLSRVPGELAWRTTGATLRPFLDLPASRTVVYWDVMTPAQVEAQKASRLAAAEAARREAARIVDAFQPGEQQSEKDHAFTGEGSFTGEASGRRWRDARDGGGFSFTLKTLPGVPQVLRLTYLGDDVGRTFDVLVDGRTLLTQTLDGAHRGGFFSVDTPLPTTAGKTITVRLQAPKGGIAGGLFGSAVMRAAQ